MSGYVRYRAEKHDQVDTMLADLSQRGFFASVVKEIHNRKVEFSSKIIGQFVIQSKRWVVEKVNCVSELVPTAIKR